MKQSETIRRKRKPVKYKTDGKCSRCDSPREGGGRYCKGCRNAYAREWRKTQVLNEEQQFRAYARVKARALREKQPCTKCGGTENVERHHPDYSKPLDIIWLCRKCHVALHRDERDATRGAEIRKFVLEICGAQE